MIYLNTASSGLISKDTMNASIEYVRKHQDLGSEFINSAMFEIPQNTKQALSKLLSCSTENLAIVPNFSFGVNAIINTISQLHKKVLLFKDDYPSLTLPFTLNDFDISWLDSVYDLERICDMLLKHNIKAIAISHVQWISGFRLDIHQLAAFCKSEDILLIIDATQSMGAMDFLLNDFDIIIASSYKWLNAGFGSAVMFLSDSFMQSYAPRIGGYNSYNFDSEHIHYEPSSRSYEPGHPNLNGIAMLGQAVKEKNEMGMDKIAQHNHQLISQLIQGLNEIKGVEIIGPSEMSTKASFVTIAGSEQLYNHLSKSDFVVTHRASSIRIAPHFYNTSEEINEILDSLDTFQNT
ncbi:MAG: aminotransferase class V-fold PLP-dependent enzyme [Flavobacteriales bacterium]|nr:aminotransferase class V-fold PLP-dependent enzyme [Flavobacteriales bacterium]